MMDFKTLLVQVDTTPQAQDRIDLAINLTKKFDAHLIGLYIQMLDVTPYPITLGPPPIQNLIIQDRDNQQKASTLFEQHVRRAQLSSVEWRAVSGYPEDTIALHGRYADLIIIGQADPQQRSSHYLHFPASLALTTVRPVLIIPYAGTFIDVGENVLLAWNGSGEATRAMTAALPLLKKAKRVSTLVINPGRDSSLHGDIPGADLAVYLARHGVNVRVEYQEGVEIDSGDLLLSHANDIGADLIIMGAYGHSRIREWIFGGVTRTVSRTMTIPVLMCH